MGVGGAIIGGSIISGIMGVSAADAQADAANSASRRSTAEQARQFNINRGDTAPYREVGTNAINQLNSMLTTEGRSQAGHEEANRLARIARKNLEEWQAMPEEWRNSPEGQQRIQDLLAATKEYTDIRDQSFAGTYDPNKPEDLPNFTYEGKVPELGYEGAPPEFQGNRFAYGDAPPEYQAGEKFSYADAPPEFQYGDAPPEFQQRQPLPEFKGGDRFAFDLESDPGYRFARDEGIKSANRAAASQGKFNSGNRLAEIADRVTGIASQYADNAFNRQLAQSGENYGRDVGEYGLDYGRETDMYGRDLTAYDIGRGRESDIYGRQVGQYEMGRGRESELYGRALDENNLGYSRGVTDYDIGRAREADIYGRAMGENELGYGRDLSEYQLGYGREADVYNRALTGNALARDKEATDYSRAMSGYGLDYQRNQDVYNRDQNYLNRLSNLAGTGQTAVAQSGAAGSNMANAIANINQANATAQGNAANTRYGAYNNAIQGGISNYLTYQGLPKTPSPQNYYSSGYVPPGGSFPPSTINYRG